MATRHDSVPEDAPERTQAERLRDQYFYHGEWHGQNDSVLPTDPSTLFKYIDNRQIELAEKLAAQAKADAAFNRARSAKSNADEAVYKSQTQLDILKLALSDALEIPK